MDLTHIYHEVNRDKNLRRYSREVRTFFSYLRETEKLSFRFLGARYNHEDNEWRDYEQAAPYIHRFTIPYRKGMVARSYQLEEWHKANPSEITLLSLTTYHGTNKYGQKAHSEAGKGITIEDSFNLLKTSWNSLRMSLRYYLPSTSFHWVMEPHETGYPHLHVVLFADLDGGTREAIRRLWSEKYGAGSRDRGVDFSANRPGQNIESIRNYLLKYLSKGFTSTGSKYGEGDDWTAGEAVFYALTWKNRWRLVGASADLCKVMAYKKDPTVDIEWYATDLLKDSYDEEPVRLWTHEGVKTDS